MSCCARRTPKPSSPRSVLPTPTRQAWPWIQCSHSSIKFGISNVLPKFLDLLVREHRTVHTNVGHTDATVAALADTAFHVTLQRRDDVALLKTHSQQILDDEAEHHRRSAHEGHRIFERHRNAGLLEQAAHHADITRPAIGCAIHREMALHARCLLPF